MTDPTFKDLAGLERWGIEWDGPDKPVAAPMHDGYWTPWHIADAELTRLRAENEALQKECNHWCSLANARQLRIDELLGETK